MLRTGFATLLLLASTPMLMGQAPLRALLGGEDEKTEETAAPPEPAAIAEVRRELAAQIAKHAERIQAAAGEDDFALTRGLTAELDALERLDWIYAQQLTALERKRDLQRELDATGQLLEAPARGEPIDAPPYNLALLDRRRAELEAELRRSDSVDDAVRVSDEGLDLAIRNERSKQRELDEAQAELASPGDADVEARLRQRVRSLLVARDAAAELTRLRRVEATNERTARTLHTNHRALLVQRIAFIRARLQLDPHGLEQALVDIDKETFDIKSDLNTAQLELTAAERRLRDTKARLDTTEEPPPQLLAQVAAARAAVHSRQQTSALLGERLARLDRAREVWSRRYQVLSGEASAEELRVWKQEALAALEDLERQRRRETARLGELRSDRQTLLSQIERADPRADTTLVALREQERHLRELARVYAVDRTTIEAAEQLNRWLIDDIRARAESLPTLDRALEGLKRVGEFWQVELFTVEDSPITLATLLTALLLFLLGWFGSRFLSRVLGQRLLPRFGLQTGATAALQTLTFYLLFVAFTLGALRMVNVPLTVFTVLGGALAIGVGFGSQNIVNNFISGLILLIEQPIKVDDLIEVDGTYGKVEHIGTRSTRVRTFANVHIIVPNSSFLEKNVINWTLSDNLVRVQVDVGVAYGSPTREVEKLILQAISENPRIVDFPVPEVFFADFGDNALAFNAYFWIKINNQNDRRRIESDVRFRVDELFREANITIAFPQRDVHLDTLRPLDVRVVSED